MCILLVLLMVPSKNTAKRSKPKTKSINIQYLLCYTFVCSKHERQNEAQTKSNNMPQNNIVIKTFLPFIYSYETHTHMSFCLACALIVHICLVSSFLLSTHETHNIGSGISPLNSFIFSYIVQNYTHHCTHCVYILLFMNHKG